MYQQYFGLVEQPFSIAVNPRYLFMSARHRDALAHLLYGVGSGGGFILLTGEVGTGKTTLNRCLLEQLPDSTDIAIVLNPALSAVELLATVCDEFNIDYPRGSASLKVLTDALHQFLLSNHRAGRRTVLMIDEAQHLGVEVLEQIRLLTNLETDEKKLLQIILTGQPELAVMLARPELRQLNQRITARFDLTPLDGSETRSYVRHRLQVAGLSDGRTLFNEAALREIYQLSGGVPRLINVLCDRALMGAYGRSESMVSKNLIREAARETLGSGFSGSRKTNESSRAAWWRRWGLASLIVSALAIIFLVDKWPLGAEAELSRHSSAVESRLPASPASYEEPPAATLVSHEGLDAWNLSPNAADAALWSLWTGERLEGDLCERATEKGLRCERSDADVWDVVVETNRPVVLDLRRDDGFAGASVLIAIQGGTGSLWTGDSVCDVSLQTLASRWRGGFHYLWRSPEGWKRPLIQGDQGSVVRQVVNDFSRLDGLPPPPLNVFTPALAQRVRQFQSSVGLEVDGVIGVRTLQALNEQLGESLTLAASADRAQASSGVAACR